MLSKIFTMVKKHAPAVLFFDEIDGIASKREMQESESARQLLSMLLAEMDGFQKSEGIVIVGSTNVPQLLDPSIMRPGRFDKIIYMPLPDRKAREAVFKYYSKKYPMASDCRLRQAGGHDREILECRHRKRLRRGCKACCREQRSSR